MCCRLIMWGEMQAGHNEKKKQYHSRSNVKTAIYGYLRTLNLHFSSGFSENIFELNAATESEDASYIESTRYVNFLLLTLCNR